MQYTINWDKGEWYALEERLGREQLETEFRQAKEFLAHQSRILGHDAQIAGLSDLLSALRLAGKGDPSFSDYVDRLQLVETKMLRDAVRGVYIEARRGSAV